MLTTGVGRRRGIGGVGCPDAGQVRGQLVAANVAVLRQLRRWGILADGEVMGPTPAAGNEGYPTILPASAELPSVAEWLKTGRST